MLLKSEWYKINLLFDGWEGNIYMAGYCTLVLYFHSLAACENTNAHSYNIQPYCLLTHQIIYISPVVVTITYFIPQKFGWHYTWLSKMAQNIYIFLFGSTVAETYDITIQHRAQRCDTCMYGTCVLCSWSRYRDKFPHICTVYRLASFIGLPTVQFLIACGMQKQRRRPGIIYHVNDISVYLGRHWWKEESPVKRTR